MSEPGRKAQQEYGEHRKIKDVCFSDMKRV